MDSADHCEDAGDHEEDVRHGRHSSKEQPRVEFVAEERASEPKTGDDEQDDAQKGKYEE